MFAVLKNKKKTILLLKKFKGKSVLISTIHMKDREATIKLLNEQDIPFAA